MASRPVPDVTPGRGDALPDSYAIFVDDSHIHVWQYRITVPEPDGNWQFVETLSQANNPRLSLEHATLSAPDPGGYWVYSRSYGCTIDCQ